MELKRIGISNYRSIENLDFEIEPVNKSRTFSLLGINESGKSSFLRAIGLLGEDDKVDYPEDFFDDAKPIVISLWYELSNVEIKEYYKLLSDVHKFDKELLSQIAIKYIKITCSFEPISGTTYSLKEYIDFKKSIFVSYTSDSGIVAKRNIDDDSEALDLNDFHEANLPQYFWKKTHDVTFWKSSPEYLILDEIDLNEFEKEPGEVSIPLRNCFMLAGIEDITKEVGKLNSPVAIQNLEELLSDNVTEHINLIWPEHPIRIKFKINNGKLTFLVEDKGVKFQNKTTTQRSDGFRQLISFLLTLSAENVSEELSNAILLLDEPETHLHPTAQLNLKNELIKLSKNANNNIVIFATHSNYMIDKTNIERCYKVVKEKNHKTSLTRIKPHISSYSEVNYEVFDIPTNDYHNELYGYLQDHGSKLNTLPKNRKWFNERTGKTEDVSLATYIRHSIHHPENTSNKNFTEKDLKDSIVILRKLKYDKA